MLIRSKEEFIDPRIPGFTSVQVMGFIRDCVVYAKPKNSIEIGTFMGRSAYAICSALKSLGGERKLLCVDFYTQVLNQAYFSRDFMRKMLDRYPEVKDEYTDYKLRPNLMDCLDLTLSRYPFMKDYIRVEVVDSKNLELGNDDFEFCFIDGDHTYEGVKNDFLKLMVTLKNGSVVVFDDNSDVFPGVKRLISEIQLTSELIYLGEEGVDIAFQVRNASMLKQQISEIYQLEKK